MRWGKLLQLIGIVAIVAFLAVLAVKPIFPETNWLPFSKLIKQGLDLQGGVHVVFEAQDTPDAAVTPERMEQAIAIIENRVNAFGVTEPLVQKQGSNRIIVELAGIDDPDEAVDNMIRTAYLEFKAEDGTTLLTGRQLKKASEGYNPYSGLAEVSLEFEPDGAKIFSDYTRDNIDKHVSIVLDGQVIQSPRINEHIPTGQAQIHPYDDIDEAHNIAVLLNSGALPVKLDVMEKRTVGPTLGADSLEKSVNAGIIGLVALVIFMILYYRLPGLVAGFALLTYGLIVLFIFIGLNVTMTLPGIVGFLLSLGMAVDANILIFERLREELWSGKTLRSAIDAGFKRAFVAIVDSNITTLIAAAVLLDRKSVV